MRFNLGFIAVLLSLVILPAAISAQEIQPAAELADALRVQLIEVQTKEESLKIQDKQLEDELKPENIERALAGIGSTKPEELRELRRRQLTIERDSVRARLKVMELSRARLEMALVAAEARAYHESALPTPTPSPLPPVQVLAGDSSALANALSMISHILLLIVFLALMLLRVFVLGRILR